MKKIPLFWILGFLLIVAALAGFLYFPVMFVLKKAFFPAGSFSLSFFEIIMSHKGLQLAIVNSLFLGFVVTALCVIISLPLAWISTRYTLKRQWLLNALMMIPMVLPPFVGAIGMKQFLARFGTLNIILMKLHIINAPIDWLGSGF